MASVIGSAANAISYRLGSLWNRTFSSDVGRISFWVVVGILVGVGVSLTQAIGNVQLAILIGFAALLAGGFVGFLFGIPRVLQNDVAQEAGATQADTKTGTRTKADNGYRLAVNTNLEQISDWLTKIIVGFGLIELKSVPAKLDQMAAGIAEGLGSSEGSCKVLALGLIVYFPVLGFLGGYLLTRLFLAPAFRRADLVAVGDTELPVAKAIELQGNLVRDLVQHVAAGGPTPGVPRDSTVGSRSLHDKTLLWVDDNPQNNTYVVAELEELGARVELARSTQEAMRRFRQGKLDGVITDMGRVEAGRRNGTAGVDLIRSIRETQSAVPILVHCSADAVRRHGEAARAAGASEVTSSPTQLLASLTRILGSGGQG